MAQGHNRLSARAPGSLERAAMGIDGFTVTEIAAIGSKSRQQVRHDAGAGRLGERVNARPGVAKYSRHNVERYLHRPLHDLDFKIIMRLRPTRCDFTERDIAQAVLRRDDEWALWFQAHAFKAKSPAELLIRMRQFRQHVPVWDRDTWRSWITEHLTREVST